MHRVLNRAQNLLLVSDSRAYFWYVCRSRKLISIPSIHAPNVRCETPSTVENSALSAATPIPTTLDYPSCPPSSILFKQARDLDSARFDMVPVIRVDRRRLHEIPSPPKQQQLAINTNTDVHMLPLSQNIIQSISSVAGKDLSPPHHSPSCPSDSAHPPFRTTSIISNEARPPANGDGGAIGSEFPAIDRVLRSRARRRPGPDDAAAAPAADQARSRTLQAAGKEERRDRQATRPAIPPESDSDVLLESDSDVLLSRTLTSF